MPIHNICNVQCVLNELGVLLWVRNSSESRPALAFKLWLLVLWQVAMCYKDMGGRLYLKTWPKGWEPSWQRNRDLVKALAQTRQLRKPNSSSSRVNKGTQAEILGYRECITKPDSHRDFTTVVESKWRPMWHIVSVLFIWARTFILPKCNYYIEARRYIAYEMKFFLSMDSISISQSTDHDRDIYPGRGSEAYIVLWRSSRLTCSFCLPPSLRPSFFDNLSRLSLEMRPEKVRTVACNAWQ